MKWLKEHIGGLVGCLIELAVGILLLVSPTAFIAAILTGCGALLLLLGAFCVGRYFFTPAEEASLGQWLFKGLLGVAAGLFLVLRADMIVAAQALLTVVYGVVLFGVGLYKV